MGLAEKTARNANPARAKIMLASWDIREDNGVRKEAVSKIAPIPMDKEIIDPSN